MLEENITEEVLPDESGDENPAVNSESVNSTTDGEPKLTLEELNKSLGKEFPDIETAVKSVKDTYSYIGKKKDDVKREVIESVKDDPNYMTKTEYEKERFFDKNPDYKPFKELLGDNPSEKIKDEAVGSVISDAIEHRKTQGNKSVIHSNARVADQSSDYAKDRERAYQTGNWAEFLEKHKGIK